MDRRQRGTVWNNTIRASLHKMPQIRAVGANISKNSEIGNRGVKKNKYSL